MPDESHDKSDGTPWKWAELLFGSGVIAYLVGATISGVWWAGSIDDKVGHLDVSLDAIERRFDGLDNVVLGNRITKVETQVQAFGEQQDRMERKIDRLLDRRLGTSPTHASGDQDP